MKISTGHSECLKALSSYWQLQVVKLLQMTSSHAKTIKEKLQEYARAFVPQKSQTETI